MGRNPTLVLHSPVIPPTSLLDLRVFGSRFRFGVMKVGLRIKRLEFLSIPMVGDFRRYEHNYVLYIKFYLFTLINI